MSCCIQVEYSVFFRWHLSFNHVKNYFKKYVKNTIKKIQNLNLLIFPPKNDRAVNLHFLLKTVEIKYNNRVPYITRGIRQYIKQKHKLYDIYFKNPTDLNKLIANYKIHRNKLTSLLRNAERTFHEEQPEINVNDSTKCWKIIKEAVGQNSVINDDNCTFHLNGNDVNDKQIISDEFNDDFVNICPKLAIVILIILQSHRGCQ